MSDVLVLTKKWVIVLIFWRDPKPALAISIGDNNSGNIEKISSVKLLRCTNCRYAPADAIE